MKRTFVLITALSLLFAGCASSKPMAKNALPPEIISLPAGISSDNAPGHKEILKKIMERNADVENDFIWIEDSYKGFMINNLSNIPANEYKKYASFLDDGAIYVIVHPAYTSFFNLPKKYLETGSNEISTHNAVERLLLLKPDTPRMALTQAQERQIRDFLEYKSTEKKLIVIIVEKDYDKIRSFLYKDKPDEFRRFINEATNESESVLYMESLPGGGSLSYEDGLRLQEFILSAGASKILLGGSYIGRCVEGFYESFVKEYSEKGIYIIPELTAVSPVDVNTKGASLLLSSDSRLNINAAADNIKRNAYGNLKTVPNIRHLSN